MCKSEQVSEEKVINHDRYTNIDITTDNSQIELIPTNDATTKVELSGKAAKKDKYTFAADVEGNTLTIQLKERQKKLVHFDFFSTSYLLKVYVPEKLYDTVQLESDNGRVKVESLQAKDIDVETDNGRIELNNVQGTSVTTESHNGRIELKSVAASTVMVKADNGKIILDDVEANISGKTHNGSISLVTNQLDRHIDFESDNGSIKIETAEKEPTNASFDVKVDNGRVNIFGKFH